MSDDLLDPNPFANPIMASAGNRNAREIYASVGLALDRWEHCETSFVQLYAALIGAERSTALTRSFGIVAAAATRREMIWHAAQACFTLHKNEELHARIRHILNLYKDAAARRNEIAHAQVWGDGRHEVVDKKAIPLPMIWFLRPPFFATRKNELTWPLHKYQLSSADIDHFSTCFSELGSRASSLSQEVRAFLGRPPAEL